LRTFSLFISGLYQITMTCSLNKNARVDGGIFFVRRI
jgi:hypothetical protein